MECFWHSNKMIIDHLIRNFRTMAPQTEDRERDQDQDQQDQQTDPRNVSLCACRVPLRKGNFNELHTLRCTLMQNKYNCKLPVSCCCCCSCDCIYQWGASSEMRFLNATQNDLSKLLCYFLLKLKTSYIIDNAFPHNIQLTASPVRMYLQALQIEILPP